MKEGKDVMELIRGQSVVPEKPDLLYHVLSSKWFKRWQAYTRCEVDSEGNTVVAEAEPAYPGPMNSAADIKAIVDNEAVDRLDLSGDFGFPLYLKRTAKEESDYMVVSQEVWDVLADRYKYEHDIPRVSVQVPTDDPGKKDHIVEVHLRRFELRTSPNIRYHEQLKMPHRLYVSRATTVKELHLQICEQIEGGSNKFNAVELFRLSRLWVFEQGDTIQDLEYQLGQLQSDLSNLPIEVHGRVL